mmetsp:Transcript_65708/g.129469  ORF Transcript_65708/g.129469 Transcript_65708/m.129469 type:complete len:212 (-) Transcript_65708:948-1583(-)
MAHDDSHDYPKQALWRCHRRQFGECVYSSYGAAPAPDANGSNGSASSCSAGVADSHQGNACCNAFSRLYTLPFVCDTVRLRHSLRASMCRIRVRSPFSGCPRNHALLVAQRGTHGLPNLFGDPSGAAESLIVSTSVRIRFDCLPHCDEHAYRSDVGTTPGGFWLALCNECSLLLELCHAARHADVARAAFPENSSQRMATQRWRHRVWWQQ